MIERLGPATKYFRSSAKIERKTLVEEIMCEDEVEEWAQGTTLWYTVVDGDVPGCGTLDICLHHLAHKKV